jgi:hypothetical protein
LPPPSPEAIEAAERNRRPAGGKRVYGRQGIYQGHLDQNIIETLRAGPLVATDIINTLGIHDTIGRRSYVARIARMTARGQLIQHERSASGLYPLYSIGSDNPHIPVPGMNGGRHRSKDMTKRRKQTAPKPRGRPRIGDTPAQRAMIEVFRQHGPIMAADALDRLGLPVRSPERAAANNRIERLVRYGIIQKIHADRHLRKGRYQLTTKWTKANGATDPAKGVSEASTPPPA